MTPNEDLIKAVNELFVCHVCHKELEATDTFYDKDQLSNDKQALVLLCTEHRYSSPETATDGSVW